MVLNQRSSTEKYLFLGITLLLVAPLAFLPYIVTHDGPAHIYNSNLILQLLSHPGKPVAELMRFNPEIVPNWIAHFSLAILNSFLPGRFAEKILLLSYCLIFPFAFRKLVLGFYPDARATTYLVFPFVQAFTFHIGFFSFSLGLCLSFYVIAKWFERNQKPSLLFVVLLTLLYFSHLFAFMITFFTVLFLNGWNLLCSKEFSFRKFSSWRQPVLGRMVAWFLVSVPALFLTAIFVTKEVVHSHANLPDASIVFEFLWNVRPLNALGLETEVMISGWMRYVYLALIIVVCVESFQKIRKGQFKILQAENAWLILALSMVFLFLVLPDDMISGGVIGIRFCLMFFLFFSIWFAGKLPVRKMWPAAFASILLSFALLFVKFDAMQNLSLMAEDLSTLSGKMENDKILMPLSYSDNWLFDNISCYIGIDRKILVLDNYEANQEHFPLQYNPDKNPYRIYPDFGIKRNPCIDFPEFKNKTGLPIDFVLLIKPDQMPDDSCTRNVKLGLEKYFEQIAETPRYHSVLYKLRTTPVN